MKPILRLLLIVMSAAAPGCSHDDECIRRYLSEPREKWCHAERTMNGEEHEPLRPIGDEEDG